MPRIRGPGGPFRGNHAQCLARHPPVISGRCQYSLPGCTAIALNTAITFYRKERRQPATTGLPPTLSPPENSPDSMQEEVNALYRAIGELSPIVIGSRHALSRRIQLCGNRRYHGHKRDHRGGKNEPHRHKIALESSKKYL